MRGRRAPRALSGGRRGTRVTAPRRGRRPNRPVALAAPIARAPSRRDPPFPLLPRTRDAAGACAGAPPPKVNAMPARRGAPAWCAHKPAAAPPARHWRPPHTSPRRRSCGRAAAATPRASHLSAALGGAAAAAKRGDRLEFVPAAAPDAVPPPVGVDVVRLVRQCGRDGGRGRAREAARCSCRAAGAPTPACPPQEPPPPSHVPAAAMAPPKQLRRVIGADGELFPSAALAAGWAEPRRPVRERERGVGVARVAKGAHTRGGTRSGVGGETRAHPPPSSFLSLLSRAPASPTWATRAS